MLESALLRVVSLSVTLESYFQFENLTKFFLCCDPLTANWVGSSDQMVPYLALDLFQNLPGLSGLYIAGAYCGALSTVSSGINSMATVIVTDFMRPILQENKTERFYLWTAKILSVILGLSSIAFAYMVVSKFNFNSFQSYKTNI